MTDWKNRIVGEGEEDPQQLLANPDNWRVHPKLQQDVLSDVLDDVGWVQRVIVNQRTGHMVDGHLRAQLAISREETAIPVTYVDLSIEEERKILATLDPIGAMAASDDEKLRDLLSEVSTDGEALSRWIETQQLGSIDSADALDIPNSHAYQEQYGVIVLCNDAAEQEKVYDSLQEQGLRCRVVTT